MSREIKFRVFHEGRMLYSESQEDGKRWGAPLGQSLIGSFMSRFAFSGEPLMQYTGLKDCDGKEIYEGDIVVFVDDDYCEFGPESEVAAVRAEVRWSEECGAFRAHELPFRENDYYTLFGLRHVRGLHVVGNVHEHLESPEAP